MIELIVTTTFGLEAVVKKELQGLGFKDFTVSDGRLEIKAKLEDIPRLNLWLRSADRVLLKLTQYPAKDFDQFFDPIVELPWEDWIPKDAKMTVVGKSVKSQLASVRTCQKMVKRAVINRMKEKYQVKTFPETGDEFVIGFSIFKDVVQITLDSTGPGLNKRGYRKFPGKVPLKETLAAALVQLSTYEAGKTLLDPMCGSGTILIEAAMMKRNIAPGLKRSFASEHWPFLKKSFWEMARKNAREAQKGHESQKLIGCDSNQQAVREATMNAEKAGVAEEILFLHKDVSRIEQSVAADLVITNPPYGIKLSEISEVTALYALMDHAFQTWQNTEFYVITADRHFPKHFRKNIRPHKIRKLYNGTIETQLYQYLST
ncbi:MAG: class I SAM-dependent RNA methyltransferase [Candidatus Omnitrophica bacterium]|nr:class I SAM-dependent RNA methyltransferase [Candidatus Omnitrophota bacterium]